MFERGSEWRRWDLHIHTPGTQKNDQYEGKTLEEKWDKFYEKIANYIGDGTDPLKNIAVIGITDYLSIDNYKKVIADGRLPESVKLVLPNIEMRISVKAKESPVNIHFIFDPSIVDELEDKFFGSLTFSDGNENYSATKSSLIRLGKTIKKNVSDDDAYRIGISQFAPSLEALQNVINKHPELRKHVLIGVSNDSNDGLSGIARESTQRKSGFSQLATVKKAVGRFVDFIFSAHPTDVTYFLGKNADSADRVMKYMVP